MRFWADRWGGIGTLFSENIDYVVRSLASLIRALFVGCKNLSAQFGIDPVSVFKERNGETDPIDGGGGNWLSGNIDYSGWVEGSAIRVSIVVRKKLPSQFGIDPRSVFYERNGESDPSDGRSRNLIVWAANYVRRPMGCW